MNPFMTFADWIEDYPEAGMIVALSTVVLCTIGGILWGTPWLHYHAAYAIQKCQAKTLLVMMSSPALVVGKIRAHQYKIFWGHDTSVLTN